MPTRTAKKLKGPGRPGRLSAEQAADLPDRLLDAALRLFTAKGYGETTMEQIAKEAGASTKTIYSRYANKADILRAAVYRIVEQTTPLHGAEAPGEPRDFEPVSFLANMGRRIDERISRDGAALNQLALAQARRFPEFAALHKAVVGRAAGIIERALQQWSEDGLLPAPADPERAAHLCISMLTDTARIRTAIGEPMTDEEIEKHVAFAARLFLRGLGYQPKSEDRAAPSHRQAARDRGRRTPAATKEKTKRLD